MNGNKDFDLLQMENLFSMQIEEIMKAGAQKLLKLALKAEIDAFISRYSHLKEENGNQRVVKNGYQKERKVTTTVGNIDVKVPRARDRSGGIKFESNIIPRYIRRTGNIDTFIPYLYLKGISTGDFSSVLSSICGDTVNASPSTIVRLKKEWSEDYEKWNNRDLSDEKYIYWWVDGIYFNVRLEGERNCILVIIGARDDGKKELVAVESGFRESYLTWKEMLLKLKKRGIEGPKLVTGDGALGFWKAKREIFPKTKEQRCWVHRKANVLDKMPKRVQKQAGKLLSEIYQAPTKEEAKAAFDVFVDLYEAKYYKAVECLLETKKETMTFYDFPAEHWRHIRSTNPIESTFATVRLRTRKTKGCGSSEATLMMVFKLVKEAEKRWQRIHSHKMIPLVLNGLEFENGVLKDAA